MKNYIEEIMKDNDLIENEVFLVGSIDLGYRTKFTEFYFSQGMLYYNDNSGIANGHAVLSLFNGRNRIEKIKPKTLMEHLKKQGDGWIAWYDGDTVKRSTLGDDLALAMQQGNVFLSKSEAEREVYRRKLEFEMQEWARENDCLGTDVIHDMNVYAGFNVFVKKELWDKGNELAEIFKEKTQKYYNWEMEV